MTLILHLFFSTMFSIALALSSLLSALLAIAWISGQGILTVMVLASLTSIVHRRSLS